MTTINRKGPSSNRSETVAVRLEPKVRYLVELAARDQQRTLSSFIETVIRKALTEGFNQEPSLGLGPDPYVAPRPMWLESLWDVDQADRLFLLAAARQDLLTIAEQRLWKLLTESIRLRGEKLTPASFRLAFHDSLVDKTHLTGEDE